MGCDPSEAHLYNKVAFIPVDPAKIPASFNYNSHGAEDPGDNVILPFIQNKMTTSEEMESEYKRNQIPDSIHRFMLLPMCNLEMVPIDVQMLDE